MDVDDAYSPRRGQGRTPRPDPGEDPREHQPGALHDDSDGGMDPAAVEAPVLTADLRPDSADPPGATTAAEAHPDSSAAPATMGATDVRPDNADPPGARTTTGVDRGGADAAGTMTVTVAGETRELPAEKDYTGDGQPDAAAETSDGRVIVFSDTEDNETGAPGPDGRADEAWVVDKHTGRVVGAAHVDPDTGEWVDGPLTEPSPGSTSTGSEVGS